MPSENTSFIELDISGMDGNLPLARDWRVAYYAKYTSGASGQGSDRLYDVEYVDGELPEGYQVVAVRRIQATTTMFRRDYHNGKQNANSKANVDQLTMNGYVMPSSVRVHRWEGINATESTPAYIERTVTFVIMPEGCIPVEE